MKQYKNYILSVLMLAATLVFLLWFCSIFPNIISNSDTLCFYMDQECFIAYQNPDASSEYYLFLPSYAHLNDVRHPGFSHDFQNLDLPGAKTLKNYKLNTPYSCLFHDEKITLTVMKSQNLPTLHIKTSSSEYKEMWTDKTHVESGDLKIMGADGSTLHHVALKEMHTRGNYSFQHFAKKPYTLKLKDNTSLLGLRSGKKYCLLSNASDPTLLRNHLARKMEETLGLPYANVGQFLDLYINGEYQGNYYLVENIEISPGRINIPSLEEEMNLLYGKLNTEAIAFYQKDDLSIKAKEFPTNPSDITGGYLVERDFYDRYKLEYGSIGSSFITNHDEIFVLKSPQECSVEQVEYLQKFFNEAEDAMLSDDSICHATGKPYTEYIDSETFAIKYLVEEFTKNYDGGVSSSYFYKDSDLATGKLYAGPGWDYDMSMGNYLEWMEFPDEGAKGITNLAFHDHATTWYAALCQKEEWLEIVFDCYEYDLQPYIENLLQSEIDSYKETLSASAAMNQILWNIDYVNHKDFVTREKSYDDLRQFLFERMLVFQQFLARL